MRFAQVRLYSIAMPLFLLPLMDFSFSAIPDYLKGAEFRAFLAEMLTQIFSGIVDAVIIAGIQSAVGGV